MQAIQMMKSVAYENRSTELLESQPRTVTDDEMARLLIDHMNCDNDRILEHSNVNDSTHDVEEGTTGSDDEYDGYELVNVFYRHATPDSIATGGRLDFD